jgi:hypothetical protein
MNRGKCRSREGTGTEVEAGTEVGIETEVG